MIAASLVIPDGILGQCSPDAAGQPTPAGVFEWLDNDADGNPIDDVLGMAKGFLGKE